MRLQTTQLTRYRPAIFASTKGISREEWLELRQYGVGGSDAGAIIGVSTFQNVFDVWMSKTSPINPLDDNQNERQLWGSLIEPVIRREFARRTGFRVRELHLMLQHPEYPWMLANIDGLLRTPEGFGVLEIKNVGAERWRDWADDRVPPMYMAQVQHYMAVMGLNFAYFATLIGGNRLIITRVERDEQFIQKLIVAEREFWVAVELQEPPPLEPCESAREYLLQKYPVAAQSKEVYLPPAALALVQQYNEAHQAIEEAKKRKEQAQLLLCDMLGDAERGLIGDYSVNWRNAKSPTRGTTRRFTITPLAS